MRFRTLRSPALIAAGVAAVAEVLGGVALAYWTTTGSGSGSASTGTMQTVTVEVFVGGDTPSSALLPGGAAADVMLRVNNPNAFAVTIVSVMGNGTISADGSHPGCVITGVTFADQPTLTIAVAPTSSVLKHLAGAATMSFASDNGCQGATFHIPVTITAHTP